MTSPSPEWLSAQVEKARTLLPLKYTGLTPQQAYDLAFYANLTTQDPLDRVLSYLGTDQRDTIKPFLKDIFSKLPAGAKIGDFGAGDGQTVALASDALPDGATFTLVEPSMPATDRYEAFLGKSPHLKHHATLNIGMEEIEQGDNSTVIPDNSLDLALCIHALYFLDTESTLATMYRKVRPGGIVAVIHADELRCTTGQLSMAYHDRLGSAEATNKSRSKFLERDKYLSPETMDTGAMATLLRAADLDTQPVVQVQEALSRFYAHQLWNLAEFGLLLDLAYEGQSEGQPFDVSKVLFVLDQLAANPTAFDIRVETKGHRAGMLSCTQPQRLLVISKQAKDTPGA